MREMNLERIRQLNQLKNNPSTFNSPSTIASTTPTSTYSNYAPNYEPNYASGYSNPTYKPANPTTYTSKPTNLSKNSTGISAIEQELLDMVALDSPYPSPVYSMAL